MEHEGDDGQLSLKLGVPKRLQENVCISCKITQDGDAPDQCSSHAKITFPLTQASNATAASQWDAQLRHAQLSLFAQELFVSLARDAHASSYASVPVDQTCIEMQVADGPTLTVALDKRVRKRLC